MSTTIKANLPDHLIAQAAILVREGWAATVDELLADTLRRYLESHSAELNEAFIREDVEWGLRGTR